MPQTFEPIADTARLAPIPAEEILICFLASQPGGRCGRAEAAKKLPAGFPLEAAADNLRVSGALTITSKHLVLGADAALRLKAVTDTFGDWPAVRSRLALCAATGRSDIQGGPKADLVAAVLRRVYGLTYLPELPTRGQVRGALVFAALKAMGAPVGEAPKKAFKLDALSRALYLGLAGITSGPVAKADAAFACAPFGVKSLRDLPQAILRAATATPADGQSGAERTQDEAEKPLELEEFALTVRKLASRLETKPYAGRVAIAQVYDAGVEQGLALGSLEDFKAQLAQAAREGLLDLERYDIAGPLDSTLKERSRVRLGRDERHFIVNQWI